MSFVIVKYGDNQQKIFNPLCSNLVLLECIRRNCKCDKGVMLDLTDAEGNVKHLNENLQSYATNYLQGRTTYWLIKVEKGTGDNPNKYTLLLDDPEVHVPDLLQRLENLSKPVVRTITRKDSKWGVLSKKLNRKASTSKRPPSNPSTSPGPKKK
ncbi:uncharacterized protein CXorf65 homolog [Ptychodera flava]|uniref:uncharacterized protein CXorf65 homolog n=1 Tax=Ptychodera flava TaxID=63121 RepID=UPI003969F16C